MWFYRLCWRQFHWSSSVLKKFISIVPLPTLAVILLTLLSQGAKLLAFFLPLKVIILIGSTGIPRYFPSSWAAYEKEPLVLALSAASIFFFLIHFISENMASKVSEVGSSRIIAQTRKLPIFTKQNELSSEAYHRLSSSLATVVMAFSLLVVFGAIYPRFLMAVVGYFLFITLIITVVVMTFDGGKAFIENKSEEFSGFIFGGGFLFVFSFMVMDFLLGDGPGFMQAIICLLLSRQLFNKSQRLVKDACWLNEKKLQINAIFFSRHKFFRSVEERGNKKHQDLLRLPERPDILLHMLKKCSPDIVGDESSVLCSWQQSGIKNIHLFSVKLASQASISRSYYLKIYDSRLKKQAAHEMELLTCCYDNKLPALSLAGECQWEGYSVHLFHGSGAEAVSRQDFNRLALDRVTTYWSISLPKKLISRYRKAHPLLPQRLDSSTIKWLSIVFNNTEHAESVALLGSLLEEIKESLSSLPVVLINPGVCPEMVFLKADDNFEVGHWGRWQLEPVGAGFGIRKGWIKDLRYVFDRACEHRSDFYPSMFPLVRLSAYCHLFEQQFNQQRYADAVALIPEMIACLPSQQSLSA
ncbi:hypothetical protein [Halomonas chromatireducens]|uniref:Uncharacterized protein n=1 Tax=Halomonas chromatireducens TaxID=507626 RepID=A0A109UL78_9GAMM|nr:hypothetical protein [Halomonas chromatireducens]AMD00098.1 hypothetical protein LOKO_01021 [Halomonas chromatireducens]